MSFSYDSSLGSDRDWVRLVLGETIEASALLSNEEIDAIIADEPNRYYAAARLGETMFSRWQAAGGGVVEKTVGRLSIRREDGESAGSAWRKYLDGLRRQGGDVAMAAHGSKVFRAL